MNISGATSGTIALSGAIGSSPISLTSNTGATINFTGEHQPSSTGVNAAFTATGGGTVSATQNNTSTDQDATGTALNVANTNHWRERT